ncbi:MAG: RNA pseudouridine synthase [Bacteroidales bacterium]|nr:RNA pseudouridine synthase [Bacteroidales bacterium]
MAMKAAEELMGRIKSSPELKEAFAEGKMLGVLVVSSEEDPTPRYLAAFSGNAGGKSTIEGFVPPIYDLCNPQGYFKMKEAEISALNTRIRTLQDSEELKSLRSELTEAEKSMDEAVNSQKSLMSDLKKKRDEIRNSDSDPDTLEKLTKESQFQKAELKRIKTQWEARTSDLKDRISGLQQEIKGLKDLRKNMSDALQEWIFRQYIVHNASGEESSIYDIFRCDGLIPPGGTGECAAPKLLEYAFRNRLKPLAMGEFWHGLSPDTAVRTQGRFYPSCTSKCGPLLKYMLKGLELENPVLSADQKADIIYEDSDIFVVSKKSGIPSVPGLNGLRSLLETLQDTDISTESVHRLDMDTSGIMIFARNPRAAADLKRQFEEHSIRKTYKARLSAAPEGTPLNEGDVGIIELPLSPDYDERPRQKIDDVQGKPAHTEYEIERVNPDESIDILLHPHTGRTHQLRVHCAHLRGLGHPIAGDLLYGGSPAPRLCLHAWRITFSHPSTGEILTFDTLRNIY